MGAIATSLAAGAIVVLALGLLLFLCGPMDSTRSGLLARGYIALTQTLPGLSMQAMRTVLGERGTRGVMAVADWTFNKPNPLVQIFYLSIVTGAVGFFYVGVWPYVYAAKLVSSVHTVTVPAIIVLLYASYAAACLADSGTVTKDNCDAVAAAYPYDNALFHAGVVCDTCKTVKPARSKHCSMCGKCIARLDHHCIWINGCVGANNHRYFLSWLLVLSAVCVYGVALMGTIVWGIIQEKRMFSLFVVDRVTGARSPVELQHVVIYMVTNENSLCMLLLFLSLVTLIVTAFVSYQLYLAASGRTTNEAFKWQDLEHYLAHKHKQAPSSSPSSSSSHSHSHSGHQHQVKLPKNIYNKGIISNLIDTFVPPSAALYPVARSTPAAKSSSTGKKKH